MKFKIASLILLGGIAASAAAQTTGIRCAERDFLGAADFGLTAEHVEFDGGYAFVASSSRFRNGVIVFDVRDAAQPEMVASFGSGNTRRFTIRDSKMYVASDTRVLGIYDIEDPLNASGVGGLIGSGDGYAVQLVGDIAIVAAGQAGLETIDISGVAPQALGIVDTPGHARDVAVRDGYAYIADGEMGLRVIDIRDPANPQIVSGLDTPGLARRVVLSDDYAFIADGVEFPDRGGGVQIIDISDPAAPTLAASYEPPQTAVDLRVQGHELFVAFRSGRIDILDITDPTSPELTSQYSTYGSVGALAVRDGLVSIGQSVEGLRLLESSDPVEPPVVGESLVELVPFALTVHEGFGYVGDRDAGLHVFDLADPAAPALIATLPIDDVSTRVAVAGQTLYLPTLGSEPAILTIDISSPAEPQVIGSTPAAGPVLDLSIRDDTLFAPSADAGLVVYDAANPASLQQIAALPVGTATRTILDGDRLFLKVGDTFDDARIVVVDVANPADPMILGEATVAGFANDIEYLGGDAVAVVGERFSIVSVEDPAMPFVAREIDQPSGALQSLRRSGNVLLASGSGAFVYDVRNPFAPTYAGRTALDSGDTGLDFLGGLAVAVSHDGLHVFDISDCCPADLDGDDATTIFDFLTFQNLFQDRDPRADFDDDGDLTLFDFLAFQDAFAAGCP
ncbi:MAG: GC-type dockerin domain-anchored protein [Phycisphaerales bacterium]